jgi:hypothetical protein
MPIIIFFTFLYVNLTLWFRFHCIEFLVVENVIVINMTLILRIKHSTYFNFIFVLYLKISRHQLSI